MSDTLTLSYEHTKLIEASGISPEVAEARGYRTVTEPSDPLLASYSAAQRKTLPALYIPSYNAHGDFEGSQIRPDNPRRVDGKMLKYESAKGGASFLDVHPDVRDRLVNSTEPILLTEGVRKADAVNSVGGICLALPGVWNWKSKVSEDSDATRVLPAFDTVPWRGRTVAIAFDSDVSRKREVKLALRRLVSELESRQAKVEIVLLPDDDDKVGLDDFLVAGHTLEEVWGLSAPADEALTALGANYQYGQFHERTHLGNAERIVDRYGDKIAWCPKTGWYFWSGKVWLREASHLVARVIQDLRDIIDDEISQMIGQGAEDEEIAAHRKLKFECQQYNHATAVMNHLAPRVLHNWDEFDQHSNMITVGNGTLVLGQTGEVELREFDPKNMLTRRTEVNYNPEAKAPFFVSTVEMALPDEDVRNFYQRAAGYSMQGGNAEQVIFMAHGSGENLKSTVLGAVKRALGKELGLEVDPASLRPTQNGGSGASPDKMRMVGARMVLAAEASDKLDPEFLKRVSGGEEIVARQLHGKPISFVPDFTLWLMFNAPPSIEDSGHGMWRRVRVIPFTHRVKNPLDSGTVNRLLDEQMEGILAWVVQGWIDYKRHGLTPPEAVLIETQAMRDELDWMADFLQQNYVMGEEGTFSKKADMWKEFEDWRGGDFELKKIRKSDFNAKLTERWGPAKKSSGHFGWSGVRHINEVVTEDQGKKTTLQGNSQGKNDQSSDTSSKPSTSSNTTSRAKNGSQGSFSASFSSREGENSDSDVSVSPVGEQPENESNSALFALDSESSQVRGGFSSGQKVPSHPYTASIASDGYRGDYERLRGETVPASFGVCQREVRKGVRCNTPKVAMPDSGFIGYCPVCFPYTGETDLPYERAEDGSMELKDEVIDKYAN